MVSAPNSYRISSADRAPLRIDLLQDSSDEISTFTARIIEDIKASNFARIELLVVKQANAERQAPGTRPDSRSLRLLRRISDPKLTSARAGCLLLFYSASLTGDWHFHPGSPISTDICRDRGAGRVFRSHNRLIRPMQIRLQRRSQIRSWSSPESDILNGT
jgi:hypothetical protein